MYTTLVITKCIDYIVCFRSQVHRPATHLTLVWSCSSVAGSAAPTPLSDCNTSDVVHADNVVYQLLFDLGIFSFFFFLNRKFHGHSSLKEYYEKESCVHYIHNVRQQPHDTIRVCVCVCVCVCVSVYLSVYLSIYLSIYLSVSFL